MAMDTSSERFDIGRVIQRTFSPIAAYFLPFLILAALLSGAPTFLLDAAQTWLVEEYVEAQSWAPIIGASAALLIALLVLNAIFQATVVRASIAHLNGRKPHFGECLAASFGALLPLVGVSVVTFVVLSLGIGLVVLGTFISIFTFNSTSPWVMFGLIILVVPCFIILFLMWFVAVPAVVEERLGVFASLARSGELTKGARWKMFALLLISIVVVAIGSFIIAGLFSLSDETLSFTGQILDAIWSGLTSMVMVSAVAATYVELRMVKEGATPQSLAAIFE